MKWIFFTIACVFALLSMILFFEIHDEQMGHQYLDAAIFFAILYAGTKDDK